MSKKAALIWALGGFLMVVGAAHAGKPIRNYSHRPNVLHNDKTGKYVMWFFSIGTTEPGLLRGVDVTVPFTPQIVRELRGLLDRAERLAEDKAVQTRIAFLRRGLDFTDIQAQAYRFLREEGDVNREAAHQVLDREYWLMRDVFENGYLAVNVAYVAWGGGGRWRRLGWQWETGHASPTQSQ